MREGDILEYKDYLHDKKRLLDNAVIQLKKEFVGIHGVIDQVADAMAGWFFFPEMQDRPVIINLWGLTGIGKTSLVKRLAQLLNYEERYYRFDLGESTNSDYTIQDTFKEIHDNVNGQPFILGFDEFQLARTINETREEIDKASSRSIWELLDNGKFDLIDFNTYQMNILNKLIRKLSKALANQVKVKDGVVIDRLDEFEKTFPDEDNEDEDEDDEDEDEKTKSKKGKKVYFIPKNYLNTLYYITTNEYLTTYDIREELKKMDGRDTILFLENIYRKAMKPLTVDCSKALIFVMGNLDEVYSMSQNFNPDISADEFHRQSLEITITQVKNSLLSRFRSEQIARLGNNHIIYPSFDSKSFKTIIDQELEEIGEKLNKIYGIQLEFDQSLKDLIYEEGVYPTQGTRPLFTTIHQIVSAKLGHLLGEVFIGNNLSDRLVFRVNKRRTSDDTVELQVDFYKGEEKVHTSKQKQKLVLGKLRKEKKNDLQAITAVHESGHAVLSSILMRTIPTSIFSVTADNQSQGFVLARPEWNYVSKDEIINRLAVLFGGIEAERLIFGDKNITIGASQDLANASRLVTYVLYSCGFGDELASYGNVHMDETPAIIFDADISPLNGQAKEWLVEAQKMAANTLEEQKVLLLKMANYLSDKRTLDKKGIKKYVEQYAVNFDIKSLVEDADDLFYRKHLKDQVNKL